MLLCLSKLVYYFCGAGDEGYSNIKSDLPGTNSMHNSFL